LLFFFQLPLFPFLSSLFFLLSFLFSFTFASSYSLPPSLPSPTTLCSPLLTHHSLLITSHDSLFPPLSPLLSPLRVLPCLSIGRRSFGRNSLRSQHLAATYIPATHYLSSSNLSRYHTTHHPPFTQTRPLTTLIQQRHKRENGGAESTYSYSSREVPQGP
jgi:hypothetical protein